MSLTFHAHGSIMTPIEVYGASIVPPYPSNFVQQHSRRLFVQVSSPLEACGLTHNYMVSYWWVKHESN